MDPGNLQSEVATVLNEYIIGFVPKTIEFLVIIAAGQLIICILLSYLKRYFEKSERMAPIVEQFIYNTVSTLSWAFILLVALSAIGLDVAPLIAGFGVAGFVVGFALKDTLSNFVAGVMIVFYKPFRLGHTVTVAGVTGKVEEIGMSLSKIKTKDEGLLVIIPNSKIWGDKITNYTLSGKE